MVIHHDQANRVAVRSRVAVISSVSCANIVCEELAARRTELAVLTHQHGCGQLGDDTALTREILAALASHPNVSTSVFVALGCETNVAHKLIASVRRRGGDARVVGIQAAGGVAAAIEQAEAYIESATSDRCDVSVTRSTELTVGVLSDAAAERQRPGITGAVVRALVHEGFSIVLPTDLALSMRQTDPSARHLSIPGRWSSAPRAGDSLLAQLTSPPTAGVTLVPVGSDFVERMTLLTAMGAHVLVSIVGRPNLTGAAIAPTICVSASPAVDRLEDLVDVPSGGQELPARVVEEVHAVIAGRRTRAEALGMRDLALPRLGPCY